MIAAHVRVPLRDGSSATIRPLLPSDRETLAEGMRRLSPWSRYMRFFAPVVRLSNTWLDYLTLIDQERHFAWIAHREGVAVATARYVRTSDAPVAELAITVVDDVQGLGLGRWMLGAVAVAADLNGIAHLEGDVLAENAPMLRLVRSSGARVDWEHGQWRARLSVDALLDRVDDPLRNRLRILAREAREARERAVVRPSADVA